MNTRSKGKGFLLSQSLQEYFQAFPINSQHLIELLPLFSQFFPKITAFIQSFDHSPAKLHLLPVPDAESEV
jgi:hypothetical protein